MNTHVPLRTILLATTLTDLDWLFPFACSLAEESGAQITVLHVITALNGFNVDLAGYPYYDPRDAIGAAEKHLQGYCANHCPSRIQSKVVAIDGTPAEGILATAKQISADAVVMGTRANRGVDKWLHGSVAEAVLRSSPIPVVTVGPHARQWAASGLPIKSVLFATSLKGRATDADNAKLTLKWAQRLGGHLTLLHVEPGKLKDGPAQEKDYQELLALLPEDAFRDGVADAEVRSGRVSREILAAGVHADLITLGAQRNPMLGRLAPEGTLYQVLAEAHCPVATLHSEHSKIKPAILPIPGPSTPAGPATL